MKKNTARLIVIAVVATIIINVILITMIWSKDSSSVSKKGPAPIEEINAYIIKEMGYDEEQAEQYKRISIVHHETQRNLHIEYREIKHRLTRSMFDQNEDEVQRLLEDLTEVVQEKEMELYRFFKEVAQISSDGQERKFGRIFREATGAPEYERNPMDKPKGPRPPKH